MSYPPTDPTPRFWRKVDTSGDCWLWIAGKTADGYGSFRPRHKVMRAHVYSFILHFGPYDRRLYVRHSCDVPACVNPAHLSLGTQFDNMRDMVARGRAGNRYATTTHCQSGHAFDEVNTYVKGRGHRSCRTCHRERKRLAKVS